MAKVDENITGFYLDERPDKQEANIYLTMTQPQSSNPSQEWSTDVFVQPGQPDQTDPRVTFNEGGFVARITRPVGPPLRSDYGRLTDHRRIIIHHTVSPGVPEDNPYHFAVDIDGTVYRAISAGFRANVAPRNNDDSIHIAAVGNWHDTTDAMSLAQRNGLINIIADVLISFPTIPRVHHFNLPDELENRFGWEVRGIDAYARHRRPGIKGRVDAEGESNLSPGWYLYRLMRVSMADDAILAANKFVARYQF